MKGEYCVEVNRGGDTFDSLYTNDWSEALEHARTIANKWSGHRYANVVGFNDQRCDYCTDSGWSSGLTEEEKEQLEEACDGTGMDVQT